MKTNWKKVKLNKIISFQKKSKRKVSDSSDAGLYPFYSSSQTQDKYIDDYDFNGPAIIFGTGGSANVHFELEEFSTSADCYVVKNKQTEDIFMRYVFLFLKGNINILEEGFRGAGLKHISKKYLEEIEIPLPPLDIQKKIADALDKADEIRRKRQELMDKLDELVQSVFLDMFGDSKDRNVIKLSKILDTIESGKSIVCESFPAEVDNWGILKLSAISYGAFDETANKALPQNVIPNRDLEVSPNDLLFSRKNTKELVGATTYVRYARKKLLLPDLIFRFRFKQEYEFLKLYIWGLFNSTKFNKQIQNLASGAAASMLNISKIKLIELDIPIYSREKIESYTNTIKLIWEQGDIIKRAQDQIDNLNNSLIQKAFKGVLEFN